MQDVIIDEQIKVAAVFSGDVVCPKWFMWHNRKYLVTETTYTWQDSQGEAMIRYFAVTDGATLFELSLNQKTLVWRLEKTVTA
jgi:hypothetical protein